ncbi:MAG: hypothetical protein ACLPTF_13870 [Steroidobacteraceae bacterium]
MSFVLVKRGLAAVVCALPLMTCASLAMPVEVNNPTGLPVYPNVDIAWLENRMRTDDLGHWCIHLSARSSASLEAVENWYRNALSTASETDLRHDGDYGIYGDLDGIKLSKGLDFVAVYKASKRATTSIDITRCSPIR